MAEIFLTPDAIHEKAGEIDAAQKQQESVLDTIQKVVEEILANWESSASKAFQAAFEAKKGTYKEFGIDMSQFSRFLRDYATGMEDIDTSEAGKLSNL